MLSIVFHVLFLTCKFGILKRNINSPLKSKLHTGFIFNVLFFIIIIIITIIKILGIVEVQLICLPAVVCIT